MTEMTRRAHLTGLAGLAASAGLGRGARAAAPEAAAPIPPQGIGHRFRHLSYSDQGGRPDGVQIMMNRGHVFIGHMFSDGFTVLDAADPRHLKPVAFVAAAPNTRSHHFQLMDDLLLVANGANIVAMQSYDSMRGYYENNLADSIANRKPFKAGLRIYDVSQPAAPREVSFLEMPGLGINRLWWAGGRYAYVSAHFDGYTDHILTIVDLKDITKPEMVSKWWMPGMWRAGGETSTAPKGRRTALHHMIVAGTLGYGAWRDGGFTIHDVSDPAAPKLLSHINWSPPFPGGTHTPLPLPGRGLAVVADESNADGCAKGIFHSWVLDVRAPDNPVPIATLPTPHDRDFCRVGNFGPHNLHENRPGSYQSELTVFATYHNAGVRAFDISDPFGPQEIAYWVPPVPKKLIDPRPNVALAAQTCDVYVTQQGIAYVSDWNAGMHVLHFEG